MFISRFVITKQRPRNFFQNSQSAEKGYLQDIDETMFIAYPTSLQGVESHDKDRFFIVGVDPIQNMKKMNPMTIWAFEGAKLGFDKNDIEGWEGIDICNYHEFPFSDHLPIYCDIGNIRIVASNNVSIRGARGINYNQDKFMENVNLKYLQECSDTILKTYFFNILRIMINSLVRTESGNPIIDRLVINEFNKILMSQDTWEQLKELATLQLC